jgi:asparagine synthase (glutamine-hydrolysing)
MCGIAGLIDPDHRRTAEELEAVAAKMTDALLHRGPDDGGVEIDPAAGVALGSRRLAIIDLSAAGHQPMWSADRRTLLAYNGELYNTADLRADLEATGHRFRGHSDTEVLLASLESWGARRTLERAVGMFAFAAWDSVERTLVLARDRFGEKPLYYGWQGGVLRFGSELRAIRADPEFQATVDRDAVALLLRHTFIPAPHSIHQGVAKLPPASFLTWSAATGERVERYWSFSDTARAASRDPLRDAASVDEALAPVLADAVRSRLVSDVPLGAFLSGGIDSSLVVALMGQERRDPVRTFTIGFDDAAYDEAPFAREVAKVLGTDHTELYVTPIEAQQVIPELPTVYDEPFADQSQIPTLLLARLTRAQVTVALSGDGGDELFGGYIHHRSPVDAAPGDRLPNRARWPVARGLAAGGRVLNGVIRRGERLVPAAWRGRRPGQRLHEGAAVLAGPPRFRRHLDRMASWVDPLRVVRGADLPETEFTRRERESPFTDLLDRMMELDTVTFLPDDVLVKMDRATMAVSLEGRAPYLDPRVAEVAWRIPPELRMGESGGKQPLRRLLARHVPPDLFERPKMGFNVPIGAWLRGPLRDWCGDLLASVDPDVLDPEPIAATWAAHQAGEEHGYRLWPVLMFQAWSEEER